MVLWQMAHLCKAPEMPLHEDQGMHQGKGQSMHAGGANLYASWSPCRSHMLSQRAVLHVQRQERLLDSWHVSCRRRAKIGVCPHCLGCGYLGRCKICAAVHCNRACCACNRRNVMTVRVDACTHCQAEYNNRTRRAFLTVDVAVL